MNLSGAPNKYDRETLQAILNEIRREDARNAKREGGIWTPSFATTGTPPTGVTYSSSSGRRLGMWRRFSEAALIWGRLTLTSKGTGGTGSARISGLPFASASNTTIAGSLVHDKLTFPAGTTQVNVTIGPSATVLGIDASGSGIAAVTLDFSHINNDSDFMFSLFIPIT